MITAFTDDEIAYLRSQPLVERPAGSGTLIMKITPVRSWSINLDADWTAANGLRPRKARHDA